MNKPVTVYYWYLGTRTRTFLGHFDTLPAARVATNEWLVESEKAFPKAYAEIFAGAHSEVMHHEAALSPYFPLADIASMPRLPHTPGARLARHFQMAGAVDQDVVERLAITMQSPGGVAKRRRSVIEFMLSEDVQVHCADGCVNTIRR